MAPGWFHPSVSVVSLVFVWLHASGRRDEAAQKPRKIQKDQDEAIPGPQNGQMTPQRGVNIQPSASPPASTAPESYGLSMDYLWTIYGLSYGLSMVYLSFSQLSNILCI